MGEAQFKKLKANLQKSKLYQPLTVRKIEDYYEVVDGAHRLEILKELGYKEVRCDVWDIDDKQAKLLLATLNRLRGTDDTNKRAKLIYDLQAEFGDVESLQELLPESGRAIDSMLRVLEKDGQIDEQLERGMIEEKLMQNGVDGETAGRMADSYHIPGTGLVLKFKFEDEYQYAHALKFFGKRPDCQKLVELIDKYGRTSTDTPKVSE